MQVLRMVSSLWLPITSPFTSREHWIDFAVLSLSPWGRTASQLINMSAIQFGDSGFPFSSFSGIGMGRYSSSHGSWIFGVCSFAGTVNELPWIIWSAHQKQLILQFHHHCSIHQFPAGVNISKEQLVYWSLIPNAPFRCLNFLPVLDSEY